LLVGNSCDAIANDCITTAALYCYWFAFGTGKWADNVFSNEAAARIGLMHIFLSHSSARLLTLREFGLDDALRLDAKLERIMDRRWLLSAGIWVVAVPSQLGLARAQTAARSGLSDGYATGDGARLYFIRSGDGPLMLFLHGHPDSWALYEAQIREFSRDHLVVAPNLRGYPPSDAPNSVEAYAMPRLLGDLHCLLDHLGRERCILVANDWGGYVAWVFASAYPGRVERLIILNAPHPAIFLRELRTNPAQVEASQYERAFYAASPPYPPWYNYYRADPIKVPRSVAESAAMETPDLSLAFFAGVGRPPRATSLRLSVPTMVIWGMSDSTTLTGSLVGLEEYVQDLTIVRIDDAGHYPMRSHPGPVNHAIREFVRRLN
jgi:pimeloyl-ACP methyl ester carboxylesterase